MIIGVLILVLDVVLFILALSYIAVTDRELPYFATVLAVLLIIGMTCILCDNGVYPKV